MAIQSFRCPISGERVTQVTNFEGIVERVICPECDVNGTCRLMKDALQGGPLAQLLERNREHTLSMRGSECVLKGVKSPGIIS
jgi:hypothetical protein